MATRTTRTTQPPDGEAELAAAEREHDDAATALEDYQRRVLDGDATCTASELIRAEALELEKRTLLAKVCEVFERRRDATAEAKRKAAIDELDLLVHAHSGEHEGDVIDLFDQAVDVVSSLARALIKRNAEFCSIREQLTTLQPLPDRLRLQSPGIVVVDGAQLEELDVRAFLAEVSARALVAAGVQPGSDLQQAASMRSLIGATDASSIETFGVPHGGLLGPSDRLRHLGRQLAERHVEEAA
jgi:hypothetical protein